jgi:hypothetical protein
MAESWGGERERRKINCDFSVRWTAGEEGGDKWSTLLLLAEKRNWRDWSTRVLGCFFDKLGGSC